MNDKTCTIYFSLHPPTEKSIFLHEREQYLSSKFWSATKKEADIFYAYYPGSVFAEIHRIVGILSGWLLKKDDLMHAYSQLTKLIDAYRFWREDKVERKFKRLPLFKKILDGMTKDKCYPSENLMDDVLNWCHENQIIDAESINQIRRKIEETRRCPFGSMPMPSADVFEILKLLVKHSRSILYDDAKALLFPDKELFLELKEAVDNGDIIARFSITKDIYYYDICSLIKWLIRKELLSVEICDLFPNLAVEAIKEGVVDYDGEFNSIKKLADRGTEKNDLFSQAKRREIVIYLKYPRKYIRWRENSHKSLELTNGGYFAAQRYNGLGELKIIKEHDSYRCQFGGLTIDMLLYGEKPEYCTSMPVYEIEFVPTKAEYDVGLQAYVSIPSDEIEKILSDENLIVVAPAKNEKPIESPSEVVDHSNSQECPSVDKSKIWQESFASLHQIAGSIQKGNKMQLADNAIALVLNAIKKIQPDFDPMKMPGTVEDFHKFCLAMPDGNKIFPNQKESFGKYCRRTISKRQRQQKMPPLCGWENPPTPNSQFWDSLKPSVKSYTVNRMAFC